MTNNHDEILNNVILIKYGEILWKYNEIDYFTQIVVCNYNLFKECILIRLFTITFYLMIVFTIT